MLRRAPSKSYRRPHDGLSPSVRERHPELPWRAIIGAPIYDDVAEEQVWRTVLEDLPALDRAIAAELEENE
jgi:uncharacterized protein with HEPN domain